MPTKIIIREAFIISLIQHIEADFSMKSQPQNSAFRFNPENFYPCTSFRDLIIVA